METFIYFWRLIGQISDKNNKCETPLGILDTKDFKDNQQVNVVVRPEAIKLNVEKSPLTSPNSGVVVDSKFLGNSAMIHMTVNDSNNKKHQQEKIIKNDIYSINHQNNLTIQYTK